MSWSYDVLVEPTCQHVGTAQKGVFSLAVWCQRLRGKPKSIVFLSTSKCGFPVTHPNVEVNSQTMLNVSILFVCACLRMICTY